jgi:hypothetical protein
VCTPPVETYPGALAAPIDFMRDEVIEICGALALAGSLLRRLGLGAEAARLESLFGAVQRRLSEQGPAAPQAAQPALAPSVSAASSPGS